MVGNEYLGYRGTSPEQGSDGYVALVVTDTYDMADGHWRELCWPSRCGWRQRWTASRSGWPRRMPFETGFDLHTAEMTLRLVQRVGEARVQVDVRRVARVVDHGGACADHGR